MFGMFTKQVCKSKSVQWAGHTPLEESAFRGGRGSSPGPKDRPEFVPVPRSCHTTVDYRFHKASHWPFRLLTAASDGC